MNITVRKCKDEQIKRKEIVFACEWFGEKLLGKRLCKNIILDIHFEELGRYNGLISPIDYEYNPRMFEMTLNKGQDRPTILKNIAHELVHLKQFARRELVDFDTREQPKYLGSVVSTANLDYWDYPWEIEAFGREIGLYTRYDEHIITKNLLKKLTS